MDLSTFLKEYQAGLKSKFNIGQVSKEAIGIALGFNESEKEKFSKWFLGGMPSMEEDRKKLRMALKIDDLANIPRWKTNELVNASTKNGKEIQIDSNLVSNPNDATVKQREYERGKSGRVIEETTGSTPQTAVNARQTGEEMRRQKAVGKDNDDEAGLIFVPVKAQAGYSRYYKDPVFVSQLLRIYLPGLPYRTDEYRIFEVQGDSMEYYNERNEPKGLLSGIYVIGERVEQSHWEFTTQFYIYVIVTEDRIMIKRLFRKEDNRTFVCISDNPDEKEHGQFPLDKSEIKELWLVKRKIDWEMPPPRRFEIKV